MAFVRGIDGSVTLPTGFNLKVKSWSADLSQAINDATSFASSGWRKCATGVRSFSGTIAGTPEFNATTTAPIPTATGITQSSPANFVLTAATGCTYTFVGYLSNYRIVSDVEDNARVAYDFVADGEVTQAWDETA